MFGTLSEETRVKVPASKTGFAMADSSSENTNIEVVDVVEGDSTTGTILKLTLHPSTFDHIMKKKKKFLLVNNSCCNKVYD